MLFSPRRQGLQCQKECHRHFEAHSLSKPLFRKRTPNFYIFNTNLVELGDSQDQSRQRRVYSRANVQPIERERYQTQFKQRLGISFFQTN